jgi:RNA polymerase sigma-70 factor, ECF subfamily
LGTLHASPGRTIYYRAMDPAWLAAVRETLPGLASDPALAAHLAAAAEAGARLEHAGELALAWAVSRGEPAAVRRFEREVMPEAEAAARKLDRDPAFVDEVRQAVRIRLATAEGGAAPRIAAYRGTGPLRAWVAVAALRVALNAKRATARAPATDVLAEVADREPDPELRHLKELYRSEFRDALAGALAALPDRQRAVLRLRFVDGLELAQIGRLYHVHESTASRWVAAALDAAGAAARERLIARLAVGAASADSIARMVASQLDLSIARLLG